MGHQDRKNASERARLPVTVEEIVAEARKEMAERMAGMVKVNDLEDALGVVRGSGRRTCRKMEIDPSFVAQDGTLYITREDARRVAERMV